MNFIAKHLDAIGLLLLTSFVAAAAGMYFNVPVRLPKPPNTAPASKYSCPMHPEVVADRAGDCPKCGMALTSAAAQSKSKSVACQHAAATTQSSEASSTSSPAGCNHPESGAGGCCSKKMQIASDALPGGCTRKLSQQPASASE